MYPLSTLNIISVKLLKIEAQISKSFSRVLGMESFLSKYGIATEPTALFFHIRNCWVKLFFER